MINQTERFKILSGLGYECTCIWENRSGVAPRSGRGYESHRFRKDWGTRDLVYYKRSHALATSKLAHRAAMAIFSFAVYLVVSCSHSMSAENSPNVVLIVADDLGYGDLGCYGSPTNKTPNIDALAKSGIRFTDFHSSGPMCTPTRVSILTGRYQQRFGPTFDGPLSGETQRHVGLPSSAVTIAELLKQKGYRTGCFGKWHLGFRAPHRPIDQGFDVFRGLLAGDGDHHSHIDRYGNEDWWHNDRVEMEQGYTADLLTKHAIQFMEENQDRPFFVYLPHLAIHFPWQGPEDPAQRVQGKDYKQDKWGVIPDPSNVHPHVRAMVESIDTSTGRILSALERLDIEKQTIVLFTSDNGGYLTYGERFKNISSNGKLRGQKGTLYEGGHRVPLIVNWPGNIPPGTSNELTHSNDLMPTICSLIDLDLEKHTHDGVDLSPVVLNSKKLSERALYWRAGNEWAIRRGPLKLVYEQGHKELFDLGQDVRERDDLSGQRPKLLRRMARDWERWNETMPK